MAATLDSADLTVASGVVAWGGDTPEGAFTNFRPDGAHAELDFILADNAALGLIRGGGTSNGRDGSAPAWAWSQHRAVWVSVALDPARAPPH